MRQRMLPYRNFLIDLLLDRRYAVYRHSILIFSFTLIALNGSIFTYLQTAEPWNRVSTIALAESMILVILYLAIVYLNIYVLVPRLLIHNRFIPYFGICSLLVVLILVIQVSVEYWAIHHYDIEAGDSFYFGGRRIFLLEMVAAFLLHIIILIGSAAPVLFRYWMDSEKRKNELEKESLVAELKGLKKQIQPRFLLKMLSEAGTLATGKPDLSSFILMRLSKLLRYQLYDCMRSRVFLTSEIAFLDNYLELQATLHPGLRYKITRQGDTCRVLLPPLLFFPLVEYLISGVLPDADSCLYLSFERKQDMLCFLSTLSGKYNDGDLNDASLTAIRQRMGLLYIDGWILTVGEKEESITVSLEIHL